MSVKRINTKVVKEEDLAEIKKFYEDQTPERNILRKREKGYLDDDFKNLEQTLEFILKKTWRKGIGYLGDWTPEYLL